MGYAGKDFFEKLAANEKRRRRCLCLRRSWLEVCRSICKLSECFCGRR